MTLNSIGDLARGLTLRNRSAEIKSQIETLSYEMSSGKVQDITNHLAGDYSHLLDLERKLERLDTFSVATAEAGLFADAMQLGLKTFGQSVSDVSSSLLSFGTANQTVTHEQASVQARNELDTMISALNGRAGGRSVFAGTATDVSPLPSTDTVLSALQAELSGLTTASDIRQAAEDWFNNPAGFDAVIYRGNATQLSPMQVSEGERIDLPITATDPVLKDALRDVAVAALASEDALNWGPVLRTSLFTQLGVDLANAEDANVKLRAEIGAAEARVEQAKTRNAAEKLSAESARKTLISADPYDTATSLQTVQFQLQSLYSVTVRNANLSLVNFLR